VRTRRQDYIEYNKVITICGSMKFYETMKEKELDLITQGYTVLMPVMTDAEVTDQTLERFKGTHLKKINMSDYIFVVNQDGYIGKDTVDEIEYASRVGVKIYFMESNRNEYF
jgi:hypothetical protein